MTALALSSLMQLSVIGIVMNYGAAREQMLTTGRPMVILVEADWCPACQQMKSSVMPDVAQRGGLDRVSFSKVNTDRDSYLAQKLMHGGSIPQLIMYRRTASGWRRSQLTGAQSVERVEQFVKQGLADAVIEPAPQPTAQHKPGGFVRQTSSGS